MLYVPFGLGNYIKVIKLSGAQLYAASAIPVYYVSAGAINNKFVANQYAAAAAAIRGGHHADQPIVVDRVPTTTDGFTTVLYFMAIGN